jgi:hypothetical protein
MNVTPSPRTDIAPSRPSALLVRTTERLTGWLADHSITILRVSLGMVFLMFGILKSSRARARRRNWPYEPCRPCRWGCCPPRRRCS